MAEEYVKTKHAGVVGWPISHSLSPRLHGFWIKKYNIAATYEAMPVDPGNLEKFLQGIKIRSFAGVNLTVPHKELALQMVDELDEFAKKIGAINTIIVKDNKLHGINTDVYGFIQNLETHQVKLAGLKCLVIGGGGAARAVCAGLLAAKAHIVLINRTCEKAEKIANDFGNIITVRDWDDLHKAMEETSLLVNAATIGMKGQEPVAISLHSLPKEAVVTDIVYNPLMTPLLQIAKERGNKIIDGLGMLLYQAQPAFEAWFGVKPEVSDELREHVLQGLV